MKRLFLSGFLFFSVLQSRNDERVEYCYTFEYDDVGNPIKLHVQMHQTTVPIVDGMRMEFAKEQFVYEQTFAIDDHNTLSKSSISNSFHAIKNEIKKPQNYQPRFSGPDISKQRSGLYCSAKVVEHQCGVIESMNKEDLMKLFLYNRYCRIFYHMSSSEKIDMMQLRHKKFVDKLLLDETLQDWVVLELWNEYKPTMWGKSSESEQKVIETLKARQCKREKKMQEQFAKIVDQQKRSAQLELEKKRLKQIYSPELLNRFDLSPYSNDRALALKQTIDSGYKKDIKTYVLDAQTTGMLMARDIDIQQLNNVSGTLFQHQLYGEVADCYKK